MQYPFLNFLRSPLIPELRSDIPAGPSCHVHLILIAVPTIRAFPHELSMLIRDDLDLAGITALLTVITLCV